MQSNNYDQSRISLVSFTRQEASHALRAYFAPLAYGLNIVRTSGRLWRNFFSISVLAVGAVGALATLVLTFNAVLTRMPARTAASSAATQTVSSRIGATVTTAGCVRPVESTNCLVVRGRGGGYYDISKASPRPDPSKGVAVGIEGRDEGRNTQCGRELEDVKWSYLGIQCSGPPTNVAGEGNRPRG
jgi:hypothetical protein